MNENQKTDRWRSFRRWLCIRTPPVCSMPPMMLFTSMAGVAGVATPPSGPLTTIFARTRSVHSLASNHHLPTRKKRQIKRLSLFKKGANFKVSDDFDALKANTRPSGKKPIPAGFYFGLCTLLSAARERGRPWGECANNWPAAAASPASRGRVANARPKRRRRWKRGSRTRLDQRLRGYLKLVLSCVVAFLFLFFS